MEPDKSPFGLPTGSLVYQRDEKRVNIRVMMEANEFATLLLGLWSVMPVEAREQFIEDLQYFHFDIEGMPYLATEIRNGFLEGRESGPTELRPVDVERRRYEEFRED